MEELRGQYVWNIQVDIRKQIRPPGHSLRCNQAESTWKLLLSHSCLEPSIKWISWISVHPQWVKLYMGKKKQGKKKGKKLSMLSRILQQEQESVVDTDNLVLLWNVSLALEQSQGPFSGWWEGKEIKFVRPHCSEWLSWIPTQTMDFTLGNHGHTQDNLTRAMSLWPQTWSLQSPGLPPPATCTCFVMLYSRDQWKCGNTLSHLLGTSMSRGKEGWDLAMASLPSRHFLQSHFPGKCALLWEFL